MFKLYKNFEPMGDQPLAIEKLSHGIINGEKDQILLGVTGSGKTFTMANIIKETNRPALILAPNKTLAAQLYAEFKKFFPENAVEYFVSYYDYYQPEAYIPTTDTYIEKDSSINDEIDKMRNAATAALMTREDVVIVASVSAIYGLGSPDVYKKLSLPIDCKVGIKRKELIKNLIKIMYNRSDVEFGRGTFRVKGDVVDVQPSYMDEAYRFEFFGDELENISMINSLTGQAIIRFVERVMIMPATHHLTEESKVNSILEEIKIDLQDRVKYFEDNDKLLEAHRIKQRTEYDMEMIKEIGSCKGIENYSRYLAGNSPGETPYTLFDYFPENFVVFIDESHIGTSQIGGMYNGDRSRKQTLVDNGFRLPSALDNRPLRFEEFKEKAKQIVYVSATPGDYEMKMAGDRIAEQLVRPTGLIEPSIEIKPTKHQVDDLLERIRERIEKNERVLVTTLTKKMAEELTDYYLDFGIKVKYMHSDIDTLERVEIIKGLRKGEFDVLVGINLLREGLDIPEVALVAILEADKEGFLRSRRSLIQTMGRAARNIEGHAILYADKMTKSMNEAISEINRRREYQEKYNLDNDINPSTIIRDISEELLNLDYGISDVLDKEDEVKKVYKSKKEIEKDIKLLEKEIIKLSKELDFENAIIKRDEMKRLQDLLLDI